MKTSIVTVVLAVVSINLVHGKGFVTGDKLTRQAEAWSRVQESDRATVNDQTDAAAFEGYIEGAVEGGEGRDWCLPSGVEAGAIFGQAANFIARHPEVKNESGYAILQDAFTDRWPCSRRE